MTIFHEQCTHVTGSAITNLYASQCRVFTRGTILREGREGLENKRKGCANANQVSETS